MQIAFSQVSKNYGIIDALKDVSFTVDSGQFTFLCGPSGSGKSTIIKLILNQIRPTNGSIKIGDIDLISASRSQIDQLRRKIGVIFQDFQLIPDKSVEENIALSLDIISYPRAQMAAKIDQVISQVGLSTRRLLYPSQLSGGELQRACLARALSVEPKIILADEPTGNLDRQSSWALVKLLKQINQDQKCTILMATHDVSIIKALDCPIIRLKKGQTVKPKSKKTKKT